MSDFAQPFAGRPQVTLSTRGSEHLAWAFNTGQYSFTGNVTWPSANQALYQAVMVHQPVTVTHMAVFMFTASGNIDVGIYNEVGTRLVSSGSTAASGSSAIQSFDLTDTTLNPGVYWLACACDNTTISIRGAGAVTAANYPGARTRGYMIQASAFPLPATATFSAPTGALVIQEVTALTRTTF